MASVVDIEIVIGFMSTLLHLTSISGFGFEIHFLQQMYIKKTRQSKQCGFSIYIFDNSKSKSMVRLVRSEKMALSGLVFARKIARMILIQNI